MNVVEKKGVRRGANLVLGHGSAVASGQVRR